MKKKNTGFTPLERTHNNLGFKLNDNIYKFVPATFRGQGSLKGFTLVELLVVIAVIALLLAILIPAMQKAKETARRVICASGTKEMGSGIALYVNANDNYLPWYGGIDPSYKNRFFRCIANPNPSKPCPKDDDMHPFNAYRYGFIDPATGQPMPFRLACLYESGFIREPKMFYCPSEQDPLYRYENYIRPAAPNTSNQWGTLPQWVNTPASGIPGFGNQWVRTGYTYYPTNLDSPDMIPMKGWSAPMYTPRKINEMDGRVPYLTDRIWKRTGSDLDNNKPKPISHRQGTVYSVNCLYKDGHTSYCKDQDVFNPTPELPFYDMFEHTQIDYRIFFYETFRTIGKVRK